VTAFFYGVKMRLDESQLLRFRPVDVNGRRPQCVSPSVLI